MNNEELRCPFRDNIEIIYVRKYHNYSLFISEEASLFIIH